MNPNSDPNKSFTVPITPDQNVAVKIHTPPGLTAKGLEFTPWASSYVLACALHRIGEVGPPRVSTPSISIDNSSSNGTANKASVTDAEDERIPILELGAGIGLVGLVAAMVWHSHAVLTDLSPVVPGLASNITLNQELLDQCRGSASCGTLDWERLDDDLVTRYHHNGEVRSTVYQADRGPKAHIILAADVVYDEDHPLLLSRAVLKWLAPGSESRFIMTLALRTAYLDYVRELWELLERGGLEACKEGQEMAGGGYAWDDERLCEWSVWRWKR